MSTCVNILTTDKFTDYFDTIINKRWWW